MVKPGSRHEIVQRTILRLDRRHDRIARRTKQGAERNDGVTARMKIVKNSRQRFHGLRAIATRVMQQDDVAVAALLFDSLQNDIGARLRPILRIDILQHNEIAEILRDLQWRQLARLAMDSCPQRRAAGKVWSNGR